MTLNKNDVPIIIVLTILLAVCAIAVSVMAEWAGAFLSGLVLGWLIGYYSDYVKHRIEPKAPVNGESEQPKSYEEIRPKVEAMTGEPVSKEW